MTRMTRAQTIAAHPSPAHALCGLLAAALLTACGAGDTTPADDAGSDGSLDTNLDAADGSAEADAGGDDAVDAPDTASDADADAHDDAAPDGSSDTGGDAGVEACESVFYLGDTEWTAKLVVAEGATLCAYPAREWFSEGEESFEQALARNFALDRAGKGTIAVLAGTWPLPTESLDVRFGLPMCATDADGISQPVWAASSVTAEVFDGIGALPGNHVRATMQVGDQDLEVTITRPLDSDTAELGVTASLDHQLGVSARLGGERLYADCNLQPNTCNTVEVEGHGTLYVAMHTWASSPGLGLAVTREISGTWEGESFAVSAYEALQTVYGHHAFDRHAFVRFDAPIGEACGLRVTDNLGEWTVAAADCDGDPLGEVFAASATATDCAR